MQQNTWPRIAHVVEASSAGARRFELSFRQGLMSLIREELRVREGIDIESRLLSMSKRILTMIVKRVILREIEN